MIVDIEERIRAQPSIGSFATECPQQETGELSEDELDGVEEKDNN